MLFQPLVTVGPFVEERTRLAIPTSLEHNRTRWDEKHDGKIRMGDESLAVLPRHEMSALAWMKGPEVPIGFTPAAGMRSYARFTKEQAPTTPPQTFPPKASPDSSADMSNGLVEVGRTWAAARSKKLSEYQLQALQAEAEESRALGIVQSWGRHAGTMQASDASIPRMGDKRSYHETSASLHAKRYQLGATQLATLPPGPPQQSSPSPSEPMPQPIPQPPPTSLPLAPKSPQSLSPQALSPQALSPQALSQRPLAAPPTAAARRLAMRAQSSASRSPTRPPSPLSPPKLSPPKGKPRLTPSAVVGGAAVDGELAAKLERPANFKGSAQPKVQRTELQRANGGSRSVRSVDPIRPAA